MKKILAIVLIATLSMSSFACANNANASTTSANASTAQTNSELIGKLKKIFQKDVIKTALDGKTISQIVSESVANMTEAEKGDAIKKFPEISFDTSNFSNDEKTYEWLTKSLKIAIKNMINSGELTQEYIDNYKGYLKLLGITIPDVEIKKDMPDDDIEKVTSAFLDVADKFTEPEVLKLMGIDLNDPETIEEIKNTFNKRN